LSQGFCLQENIWSDSKLLNGMSSLLQSVAYGGIKCVSPPNTDKWRLIWVPARGLYCLISDYLIQSIKSRYFIVLGHCRNCIHSSLSGGVLEKPELMPMVFHFHLTVWCWCSAFTQQRRLFLTALYLLVWGEASNLRFMPECLCYIFHHVSLCFLTYACKLGLVCDISMQTVHCNYMNKELPHSWFWCCYSNCTDDLRTVRCLCSSLESPTLGDTEIPSICIDCLFFNRWRMSSLTCWSSPMLKGQSVSSQMQITLWSFLFLSRLSPLCTRLWLQ